MFEIGFSEILLTSIVAIVVVGPEKFPSALKACIKILQKIKRYLMHFEQDLEKDLGISEVKRQLHNEYIMGLDKKLNNKLQLQEEHGKSTNNDN